MNNDILNMLNSPNPVDRKRGIQMLAKTEDEKAIPYLSTLYKTDKDPEVKEFALKAGRYIKSKQMPSASAPAPEEKTKNTTAEKKDTLSNKVVSPKDVKKSQEIMNRAMVHLVANENEQAFDLAVTAVQLNPDLRHEHYYMGMMESITGLRQQEAFDALMEANVVKKGRRKGKDNKDLPDDHVSWGEALVSLLIFSVVTGAVTAIGLITLIQITGKFLGGATDMATFADGESQGQLFNYIAVITANSTVLAILFGVVSAIGGTLQLLIQFGVIHMVATILGGAGEFKRVVHRLSIFYAILNSVASIILFAVLYNAIADVPNNPGESLIDTIIRVSIVVIGLSFLVQTLTTVLNTTSVSDIYQIDLARAFGALAVSGVVINIIGETINPTDIASQILFNLFVH